MEKKNAKKKAGTQTKPRSQEIPLENIPERAPYKSYTEDFKRTAANRVIGGETSESVARSLGIPSSSTLNKWVQLVREGLPFVSRGGDRHSPAFHNPGGDTAAALLRQSLLRSQVARNERLEAAATIVECDIGGKEGADMAKKIREQRRQQE